MSTYKGLCHPKRFMANKKWTSFVSSNLTSIKIFLSFLFLLTILTIFSIISTESSARVPSGRFARLDVRLASPNIGSGKIVRETCGTEANCLTARDQGIEVPLLAIEQPTTSLNRPDVQISHPTSSFTTNHSQKVTTELPAQRKSANDSDAWWESMMRIQKERKSHLRKICRDKYGQNVLPLSEFVADNKNLYSFYFVDKFKLLYSFVHKVGSSNWSKLFKTIHPKGNLKRLYTLPRKEALWRLREYSSFIIVRHPLARLLSAYKDKFLEHHIAHFKSIGRTILKRFRQNVTQEQLQNPIDVTFEEFLRYLVANKRNRGNTHWDHVIIRNKVCLYDFDVIGKLETGQEDTELILKTFRMEKLAELGSEYKNYTGRQETLRTYYSQIPMNLLKEIFRIYESDFLLFNYSMSIP